MTQEIVGSGRVQDANPNRKVETGGWDRDVSALFFVTSSCLGVFVFATISVGSNLSDFVA